MLSCDRVIVPDDTIEVTASLLRKLPRLSIGTRSATVPHHGWTSRHRNTSCASVTILSTPSRLCSKMRRSFPGDILVLRRQRR